MATTADYLNKLVIQKNALADNLVTKGVTATHDETLETLVPKVLKISSGSEGIYPIGEDSRPTGDVIVSEGVISLYQYVFYRNINVMSVLLPNSLTTFSEYCFQDCTNLSKINIPDNVSKIPQYCFSQCSLLLSINIPSACTSIDSYAFQSCISLSKMTIAENASYNLGQYAFADCSALTNELAHDIIEHSLSISVYIFRGCTGLTNVEVSKLWTGMFYGCNNLITAKCFLTSGTGDNVFYDCKKLQEAYIDGATTIGTLVFKNCSSLKIVHLPSSITTARNNSLTSTSSYDYAFDGCTALEDVQLGQDWNMSLRLDVSNNITVESMVAMFDSLKDLTGETAKTLTLGATNLAKLTDEQKLIATNKNWTLA